MGWPAIQGYQDGNEVVASVLNLPLNQLAERTDFLHRLLENHDRTKVSIDVDITDKGYGLPSVGQPVYRVPDGADTYAVAAAVVGENAWFYADPSAMAVGIVSEIISESRATIVLYGRIQFSGTGLSASSVIADETPVSGRYYLSTTHGKLTASPSGPIIYACDCQVDKGGYVRSMLVNPQYRDTGESHIHRAFVISGEPMGGYSVRPGGRYHAPDIVSDDTEKSVTTLPTGMTVRPYGAWTFDGNVTYTLGVVRTTASGSATDWANYGLSWTSAGLDKSGTEAISFTGTESALITIGTHGLKVQLRLSAASVSPETLVGETWTVAMPDAGRAWVNFSYAEGGGNASSGMIIVPSGALTVGSDITYAFSVSREEESGSETDWSNYRLAWASSEAGEEGKETISFYGTESSLISIGTRGLKVKLTLTNASITPDKLINKSWSVCIRSGFRLNLGMYPALARYVPPLPENGAALTVEGLDLRGIIFPLEKQEWRILPVGDDGLGGPWLVWFGGIDDGTETVTTPFVWRQAIADQHGRNLVLHVNRMRVGPTGFVTSLQPAPGSPFRITSAQTDADAVQGALQIALDIDFKTAEKNIAGSEVVKRITGSTFETGPVVERIIAGPGLSANREQGSVTVSVSNAVYAGDFETIALKNAKQDLAGGVFPYTKLLSWTTGSVNIDSGFTAKFRVPDHIPYKKYKVIVSASVFGEVTKATTSVAAFRLTNYLLADQACSASAVGTFDGSVASPITGAAAVIPVTLTGPYTAFDPVLIHGFPDLADPASGTQRQKITDLLLKKADGTSPVEVYPGYFIGLNIARCGTTGTEYTNAIGILSLRWNLVEVEGQA